jgi:hypothetical protein
MNLSSQGVLLKPSLTPPNPILFHKANVDNKVGIIMGLRKSAIGQAQQSSSSLSAEMCYSEQSKHARVFQSSDKTSEVRKKQSGGIDGQLELFGGGIVVTRDDAPSTKAEERPLNVTTGAPLSKTSFAAMLHQDAAGKRSKPTSKSAPAGNKRLKKDSEKEEVATITTNVRAAKAQSLSKPISTQSGDVVNRTPTNLWSDISGIEYFCRNAGSCEESLSLFEQLCSQSSQIALCMLWEDGTSNHSETSRKICTPSRPCGRWNCACDRSVRALQSHRRLVAVAACLSVEQGEYLYILPLNSTHTALESGERICWICLVAVLYVN